MADGIKRAIRSLQRTPTLALAAVVIMAIGIGAAAAAFSLVNSIVTRPLPFPDADRLVWIHNHDKRTPDIDAGVRMSQYRAWRERADRFEAIAAWHAFFSHMAFNVTGPGEPESLTGIDVSPSLFTLFGGTPVAGRLFTAADEQLDAPRVVVLSEGYWRRRFASRPDVIGTVLRLNGQPATIVGVIRSDFAFASTFYPSTTFDIYTPVVLDPRQENFGFYLAAVGRIRTGNSVEQNTSQLSAIQGTLAVERSFMAQFEQRLIALDQHVTRSVRTPLLLLLGGVLSLVLVGCANLANLQLARINARARDIAIRAALGAGRARLMRETLFESLVLSALAGTLGLLVPAVLLPQLAQADWLQLPRNAELRVGVASLIFTVLASTVTGLAVGWFAAVQAGRSAATAPLKRHGGLTGSLETARLQRTLTVAQIALAFMLLTSAALLIRSFERLVSADLGFQPQNVLGMRLDPGTRYPEGVGLKEFFDRVLADVRTLPGVTAATLAMNLPLDRRMMWDVGRPGTVYERGDRPSLALTQIVTPGYFETVGTPLIAGRDFGVIDNAESPRVAIVNETLVRQLLNGREPLGAVLSIGSIGIGDTTVIGVAADVRHAAVAEQPGPQLYVPYHQTRGFTAMDLVVRSTLPVETLTPAIRRAVWSIEPTQAIGRIFLLRDLVDRSTKPRGMLATAAGAFGFFALVLCAAGLYGLMAYAVSIRRQEIGLRMAVGASPGHIVSMILAQGGKLVLAGVAIGLFGSLAVNRILDSFLFGITTSDVVTYAVALATIGALATVACSIPALRASRMHPAIALQQQ